MGHALIRGMAGLAGAGALCAVLAGCSSMEWLTAWESRKVVQDDGTHQARVRDRTRYEAEAAVGRAGAHVCRKIVLGIAEEDWIKGTVVEARDDRIRVKIEDPGKFPHEFDGKRVAMGTLFWDEDIRWIPCVK